MNTNKKNYIFIVAGIGLWLVALTPLMAAAYEIEIGLPNLESGTDIQNPAQYFQYFFIFGLALIGFLAVGALVAGGMMWMLGGSISSVEKAKNIIVGGLSGLILLLASYLLLYTIDPKLTDLTPHIVPLSEIQEAQQQTGSTAGGGAQTYQWTDIPTNKYCAAVLRDGWVEVDDTHCQGKSPGLSYRCCGYFKKK